MKSVADNKRNENIAEYILYMWQVEDMVRAMNLDISKVKEMIIDQAEVSESDRIASYQWYENIIAVMKRSQITQQGHLPEVREVLNELQYLHSTLINIIKDQKYLKIYEGALPMINEFREKSGANNPNDIEVCLNGLYRKLMLKLQHKELSKETEEAMEAFRKVIAELVMNYKKMQKGELSFHNN